MYGIRFLIIAALFASIACDGATDLSSTDMDKFLGSWVGSYDCGSPADTMIIARGSGELGFGIALHAQITTADVVTGELTDVNVITIPEQTIGGFAGSGEIRFSNNMLSLTQEGLGFTCTGSNYVKF